MEFDIKVEGAIGTINITGDKIPSPEEIQIIYGAIQKIVYRSFNDQPCLYIQGRREGVEINLMGSSRSGTNAVAHAASILQDELKIFSESNISMEAFIEGLNQRHRGAILIHQPVRVDLAG